MVWIEPAVGVGHNGLKPVWGRNFPL